MQFIAIRKTTCTNCERQQLDDTKPSFFPNRFTKNTCFPAVTGSHVQGMLLPWAPKIKRSWSALREATEPSARSFLETAPEPRKESKPGCLSKCCLAKKYELMIVEYCKIAHTYKQTISTNTIFLYSTREKHLVNHLVPAGRVD